MRWIHICVRMYRRKEGVQALEEGHSFTKKISSFQLKIRDKWHFVLEKFYKAIGSNEQMFIQIP